MSISPASSEVGSCLNRVAASTSIVASNREGSKINSQSTSTSKHYKSNKGKPHHRIRNRDRSDLDLDWRRSTTSGGNTTTATSGSGGGSSSSHHASKTMSADEDPDWRNHKAVEKNNDACNTNTSSTKPSKFKGRPEIHLPKSTLKRILIYQFTFSLCFSFFFTFNFMKIMTAFI